MTVYLPSLIQKAQCHFDAQGVLRLLTFFEKYLLCSCDFTVAWPGNLQICLTVLSMHSNAQLFPTTACTDSKQRQGQWKMKSTWKSFSPPQAFIVLLPWQGWEWQSSCNNHVWKTKEPDLVTSQWRFISLLFTSQGPLWTPAHAASPGFHRGWIQCTC